MPLSPLKHQNTAKSENGFTLIEIVIVIVILSILAVGSTQFISFSAQGYVDTVRRSELSSTATIVNEKISRLIRDALPNSIRITSGNQCIEFMPILAASRYTQAPFASSASGVSRNNVHVVPLDSLLDDDAFVSIFPMPNQQSSLYSGSDNPGYLSLEKVTENGSSAGSAIYTFNNSAAFEFLQTSPRSRIYFVDSPVTFCQSGDKLYFYRNYGRVSNLASLISSLPTSIPNRLLIADKLQANSLVFSYLPSSLRRNAIVAYELELQDASNNSETLVINQEVQIRNVP